LCFKGMERLMRRRNPDKGWSSSEMTLLKTVVPSVS
jgi:hypothetical protein